MPPSDPGETQLARRVLTEACAQRESYELRLYDVQARWQAVRERLRTEFGNNLGLGSRPHGRKIRVVERLHGELAALTSEWLQLLRLIGALTARLNKARRVLGHDRAQKQ